MSQSEGVPRFEICNNSSVEMVNPTITLNGLIMDDEHHFEDAEGDLIVHRCPSWDARLVHVSIPTLAPGGKFTIYHIANPGWIRRIANRLKECTR